MSSPVSLTGNQQDIRPKSAPSSEKRELASSTTAKTDVQASLIQQKQPVIPPLFLDPKKLEEARMNPIENS